MKSLEDIRTSLPPISQQEQEDLQLWHAMSHLLRATYPGLLECAIVVMDGDQRPYLKVRKKP